MLAIEASGAANALPAAPTTADDFKNFRRLALFFIAFLFASQGPRRTNKRIKINVEFGAVFVHLYESTVCVKGNARERTGSLKAGWISFRTTSVLLFSP